MMSIIVVWTKHKSMHRYLCVKEKQQQKTAHTAFIYFASISIFVPYLEK